MKEFFNLGFSILAMLLFALCTYWAWNSVADLFPCLPVGWQHLSFMRCFWLGWLLRLITGVTRTPDINVKLKEFVQEARKR